jgi:hypothetical protein
MAAHGIVIPDAALAAIRNPAFPYGAQSWIPGSALRAAPE